jgi:hypothetical protein
VSEPAPYPPAPKGTKYRQLPFPCGNPDRTPPAPEKVTGKDGKERTWRSGLPGLAPPADPADLGVTDWTPL